MKKPLTQPEIPSRTDTRGVVHENAISLTKIDFPSYFRLFTSFFPAGRHAHISFMELGRINFSPRYSSLGRPVEVA